MYRYLDVKKKKDYPYDHIQNVLSSVQTAKWLKFTL